MMTTATQNEHYNATEVDEPIEVVCQCAGHLGGRPGRGRSTKALDPLVGEAMDPLAQRGIGKVQRESTRTVQLFPT